MTLIQKYKDNPELFKFICESYSHCECIDKIEGQVIHGEYSGHQIKNLDTETAYFVEDGIRGFEEGWYHIKNGEPVKIPQPLNINQLRHLLDIIEVMYAKNNMQMPSFLRKQRFITGGNDIIDKWTLNGEELNEAIKPEEKHEKI